MWDNKEDGGLIIVFMGLLMRIIKNYKEEFIIIYSLRIYSLSQLDWGEVKKILSIYFVLHTHSDENPVYPPGLQILILYLY